MLYRDLKPENILIDSVGNIKLADFGICKHLEAHDTFTQSIIGTPQYLAPEIFTSDKGYNYSVDIWSLGCTLYEMVSGNPPFQGPSSINIMKDVILTQDLLMKEYFSKDFISLMEGLLNKNSKRRLTLE